LRLWFSSAVLMFRLASLFVSTFYVSPSLQSFATSTPSAIGALNAVIWGGPGLPDTNSRGTNLRYFRIAAITNKVLYADKPQPSNGVEEVSHLLAPGTMNSLF
jgi:hypothetical protein